MKEIHLKQNFAIKNENTYSGQFFRTSMNLDG